MRGQSITFTHFSIAEVLQKGQINHDLHIYFCYSCNTPQILDVKKNNNRRTLVILGKLVTWYVYVVCGM